MNRHIVNERDRSCMQCDHKWTAPVEHSPYTRNLTGEVTPPCPKCGSKSITGGPNKAYVHMERVCRTVAGALVAVGAGHAATYQQWANGWADPHWEIKLTGPMLNLTFYLHQEERVVPIKTLLGKTADKRWMWAVNVLLMKTPSNRDEPPYEDNFEVCINDTAEGALIEATLCYFRNTMYDSISVVEPEVEEAWP